LKGKKATFQNLGTAAKKTNPTNHKKRKMRENKHGKKKKIGRGKPQPRARELRTHEKSKGLFNNRGDRTLKRKGKTYKKKTD